ncbi:uncharacterized protein SCHCODRAFT_02487465, partial [Schizophyllum commune H4-8]|uniref:uncharacterized protein n=1 Tax=Schizophyllum commune (strain H4-8 / FGSC 9210) TaxID=578458 RepID=UPI00215EBFAA
LTQLRSGHVGLFAYLARVRAVDSALCTTCGTEETVDHYLFECRRYKDARHRLRVAVGGRRLDRACVLGEVKNRAALLAFVQETGRLAAYAERASSG